MFESLLESVRREVSGERALETVTALAGFHRVQASPGYDDASAWMEARLRALGLRVEIDRVPGDGRTRFLGGLMPEGWSCARAVALLHDGRATTRLCDADREPLSVVIRSASARGRFPLVTVGEGTEPEHYRGIDVRGRVVLASGAPHRVLERAVHERGAAGLLCDGRRLMPPVRGPHDDADALPYTSFWWNADQPRGWGFVVSPAEGARLRAALASGRTLELEVEIDARAFATEIPLLSAVLPGDVEGETLVVSHLCHPRPSANDNASGAAANLETARALTALERAGALPPHRRSIRFLWVPELTGTYAWLRDPARARCLAGALNLDMVGEDQARCGSTFLLEHPPCFAGSFAEELVRRIRHRAQDWVTSFSGPGHFSLTRLGEVPYSGGSDQVVFADPAIGVPCPLLIQWPDLHYHSSHDTPDRCDPRSLALASRTAATYAAFLAACGPAEIDWLTDVVGRGARRRILEAADAADPGRAIESERLRGRTALASLGRLDADPTHLRRAGERLDDFCAREGFLRHDEVLRPSPARGAEPPARVEAAPLEWHPHLLSGWETLSAGERESYRAFTASVPGGPTLLELAWAACDGERTLEDIARLVWLETGHHEPDAIERWFEWTARLGLSGTSRDEEE